MRKRMKYKRRRAVHLIQHPPSMYLPRPPSHLSDFRLALIGVFLLLGRLNPLVNYRYRNPLTSRISTGQGGVCIPHQKK